MTIFCVLFYLISPIIMGIIGIGIVALIRFLIQKQLYFILFMLFLIILIVILVTDWNNILIPEIVNSCL
jgi:hypothetical protein